MDIDLAVQRKTLRLKSELPSFIVASKLIKERFPDLKDFYIYEVLSGKRPDEKIVNYLESQVEFYKNI